MKIVLEPYEPLEHLFRDVECSLCRVQRDRVALKSGEELARRRFGLRFWRGTGTPQTAQQRKYDCQGDGKRGGRGQSILFHGSE